MKNSELEKEIKELQGEIAKLRERIIFLENKNTYINLQGRMIDQGPTTPIENSPFTPWISSGGPVRNDCYIYGPFLDGIIF